MKMRWMMVVMGMALGAIGADSAPDVNNVPAVDLERGQVQIIGVLGKPLGTYVTIEAAYDGQPSMIKTGGLKVNKVDGRELKRPVQVALANDLMPLGNELVEGKRYTLRGYETGGMDGYPDDPQNPPPKEGQARQAAWPLHLSFSTRFVVTKAEAIAK